MNKAESGLQLLNRLNDRPALHDFDRVLFPNGGPFPKEVIEITGESNTGKTILLTEIIAKAILPLENGGRNVGVLFINTEHHFQIIKLITIMERIAIERAKNPKINTDNLINAGLRNLHILDCYDSVELGITMKSLDGIFAGNSNVTILVMDNIAPFYWSEQFDKTVRMDTYYRKMLRSLQSAIWEYKTIIFYTRPLYFFTQNPTLAEKQCNNFSDTPNLGYITYRITLEIENEVLNLENEPSTSTAAVRDLGKILENLTYQAKVRTSKIQFCNKYSINERGIAWNI